MIVVSQTPLGSFLGISSATVSANYGTLVSNFTLVSPIGTEVRNWTKNITWTTTSLSPEVDLWYCAGTDCGDGSYTLIAANVPNELSYSWDTTTAAWDSTGYKIRVSLPWGSNGWMSPNYFTLDNTPPAISISDDILAGPVWSDSFAATGTDTHLSTFKYGYVDNAWDCTTSVNTAGFTTYTWTTVNLTNETHNNKYVCFYADDTAGNKNVSVSANPIKIDITNPSISITNDIGAWPTQTESFAATITEVNQSILEYGYVATTGDCNTWANTSQWHSYPSTSTVNITDQSNNNNYVCFFAQDLVGRKAVVISANKINIDSTNPTIWSSTLTSPNGWTYWTWGSVHNITWNSGSISDTNLASNPITLKYSTNGGDSWTTIATNEANDGTYSWTTPNTSATFLIKITAVDNATNSSYDTSDTTFIIDNVAPTVSSIVATPNPWSGTVNVTVYFTEALAWIYISQPPTVVLVDGWDHSVSAVPGDASHTNGFRVATPTIWDWTINISERTNGTLHFKVSWARDKAYNTMEEITTWTMVVDTVWPTYTINNGTDVWPVKIDTINVTVNDAHEITLIQYGFTGTSTWCASATYNNSFSSNVNFSITWDHTNYLCIKGVDTLGNISYTGWFLLNTDNTPTAAPTISTPIVTPAGDTTPNIGITVTETGQFIQIYSGANLFQTSLLPENGANTITLLNVWEWVHSNFSASFTDQAGNESATGAIPSFIVDLTAPVVTLTNRSYPDEMYTNDTTPTFTGHVTDNLTNIASVEYSLNWWERTGVGVTAIDGSFNSTSENYSITLPALADGTWSIVVRATDVVGNASTSNPGRNFVIDTATPTIVNVPNVTVNANNTINVAWLANTTGSSNIVEAQYSIHSIDIYTGSLSLWDWTTERQFYGTIDISNLTDWAHTITVKVKNLAGTRSNYSLDVATQSFTRNDNADPIITPISVIPSKTTAAITFSSNETWYADMQYGLTDSYGNSTASYDVLPGSSQTITLTSLTCGTTYHYLIRAEDLASPSNRWSWWDQTFSTLACDDTTAPTINYTAIANQYNVSEVPSNITFTLADNTAVTTLTLNNSNVFSAISWWVYTLSLSRTLWLHEYVLIAGDAAGNKTTATITYNVLADSVTNINVIWYRIYNLSDTGVLIYRETDESSVDNKVDFYTNGYYGVSQTGEVDGSGYSVTYDDLMPNRTYTVIIKSKVAGQGNYTTLSFPIKTASSKHGIIVKNISRLGNDDTDVAANNTYASGYHYRFDLTINDLNKDTLRFKLADWSNSLTTMAVANNTKVFVSEDGVNAYDYTGVESNSTTLTGSNTYSNALPMYYTDDWNTYGMDAEGDVGGRQVMLDIFYKIPTWSQGIFSTSYGIQASTEVE